MELLRRAWILTGAALMLGLGVLYAWNPAYTETAAGILLSSPAALAEVRSTYGGLHIGIGVFLGYCSATPLSRRFGLLFCGLVFLFAGVARFWGVVQFEAGLPQVVTAALELGFSGGALWLWRGAPGA